MKEAVVILSLFGCNDAGQSCEYIPTTTAAFASEAACLRKSEHFFEKHSAVDFPVVLVKCDAKAPSDLDARPNDVALFDGDVTEHQVVSVELASNRTRQQGWLEMIVEKPTAAIATHSGNAATWVQVTAQNAVNAINPF